MGPQDHSSEEENESHHFSNSSSFESDISSDELTKDQDPESKIYQYFQKFYENNVEVRCYLFQNPSLKTKGNHISS